MAKAKEPDQLAQDAASAKAAGLSYGKWKAMQGVTIKKSTDLPEGWKRCEWCNTPFKAKKNQRFCGAVCQKYAQIARNKAKEHKEKEVVK